MLLRSVSCVLVRTGTNATCELADETVTACTSGSMYSAFLGVFHTYTYKIHQNNLYFQDDVMVMAAKDQAACLFEKTV